jgi:UDP-2,3-diacylglucosamine pyrophosphatase LpxH
MLVIISDLHLSDGTSGETISAGAFRIFRERLSDMAYDASWRTDGTYKPVARLELLLLGDILDLIRSTRWVTDMRDGYRRVRPWDDHTSQPFIDKVRTISDSVLDHNANSLAVLSGLNNGQRVTIPPATAAGLPARVSRDPKDPNRVPVEVRTHYMVGNHDWFYHLPGPAYDEIRQSVVEAMGLVNSPFEPFPHDPAESTMLQEIFDAHQVLARHGDIFDPNNYEVESGRNASSLGDAVVVEILNRFPTEVAQRMGPELPETCLDGLKELDNVRPMLVIPIWINGLLRRTCADEYQIRQVKQIWDELADEFLSLSFVRSRDKALDFFDGVDQLEWALKFSKGVSLQTMSELITWIKAKIGRSEETYFEAALAEPAFRHKRTKYFVNGHTHHREIIPLDTVDQAGKRFDQMYFNSGTWRRVHELARFNPREQEFMGYHEMTYFAFYQADERKGRPYEGWSGTLGIR